VAKAAAFGVKNLYFGSCGLKPPNRPRKEKLALDVYRDSERVCIGVEPSQVLDIPRTGYILTIRIL
jgi:hypothetical protein